MNKRDFLRKSIAFSKMALGSYSLLKGMEGKAGIIDDAGIWSSFRMERKFTSNPLLETLAPGDWAGTPFDENRRFMNLNHPFIPGFSSVLKWKSKRNPQKSEKKADVWIPGWKADGDFLNNREDCLVWLGHASFFLRLNGINLLVDPVFGRATIVNRLQAAPYPTSIWKNIHLILISHDHRDHCDFSSLKILARQNPEARILCGLGMKKLLSEVFPAHQMEEAGWYQKFGIKQAEIWFLPARHWGKRNISDTNRRLWGSFYIHSSKRIYFMGDSGRDSHFAALPELHPAPDIALMGIGAYSPEWFMHPNHMNPEDSWQSFLDLKAAKMIPMHYGTFDLSDEPVSEPLRRLVKVAESEKLIIPSIGETLRL